MSTSSPDLAETLKQALDERGPDYRPNTRHLDGEGRPLHTNRLILESSPYLLQHAHNPVDWYPWGREALAEARKKDCPIFLSVGYATCHWCHVMEEESFDDEAVASALKFGFIAVKLDREARPDLDHAFMVATQAFSGSGGWPNSLFLTPEGKPFFAGTYFPKHPFLQLLASIRASWNTADRRRELVSQADQVAETVKQILASQDPASAIAEEAPHAAAVHMRRSFNSYDGGFSRTTQFPQETYLLFLLDYWRRYCDYGALAVAMATLHAMASGGLHDQIGGGFHRYTVDVNWRTPHFEKMLYNQALLLRVFTEAYSTTGTASFRRAANRIVDYLTRDMIVADGPAEGAFYAAEDADSETPDGKREEGYFYVWNPDQVIKALGEEDGHTAVEMLGIDRRPTVESGSVPHLHPDDEVDFEMLDSLCDRLLEARASRPRPRRDDKVLADWNGLTIRALADAGVRLRNENYINVAVKAGEAVWSTLYQEDGGLRHFFAEGKAEGDGLLADHACLGLAFIALAEATQEAQWIQRAEQLAKDMQRFGEGSGRFRESAEVGPLGPIYLADDGATPSGESSALEFLARLVTHTGSAEHRSRAELLRSAVAFSVNRNPPQRTVALVASEVLDNGPSEPSRPCAQGHGHVLVELVGEKLRISVTMQLGWHVNSNQPLDGDLSATEVEILEGPSPVSVTYPEPVERSLSDSSSKASIYEGKFEIEAVWDKAPSAPLAIVLRVQACSGQNCLLPESHVFLLR